MDTTSEEMLRETGNLAEEKRRKVLEKIKTIDEAELQVIYQSLFFDEIIDTFNQLPKPARPLTNKEIDDAIFKSRKKRGFYTKNSEKETQINHVKVFRY